MLIQVLEDAGADVTDSTALAGTVATREALVNGQIDVYMEYTGTGWITHLGNADPIPDPQEQWQAVKDADLEQNGIAWLGLRTDEQHVLAGPSTPTAPTSSRRSRTGRTSRARTRRRPRSASSRSSTTGTTGCRG